MKHESMEYLGVRNPYVVYLVTVDRLAGPRAASLPQAPPGTHRHTRSGLARHSKGPFWGIADQRSALREACFGGLADQRSLGALMGPGVRMSVNA